MVLFLPIIAAIKYSNSFGNSLGVKGKRDRHTNQFNFIKKANHTTYLIRIKAELSLLELERSVFFFFLKGKKIIALNEILSQ